MRLLITCSLFCLVLKGIGNKTEISVRGQDRLIISSPSQRNEKSTPSASPPEATSGSAGGYDQGHPHHPDRSLRHLRYQRYTKVKESRPRHTRTCVS